MGVAYQSLSPDGLRYTQDGEEHKFSWLPIILWSVQVKALHPLAEDLKVMGKSAHLIGGALNASKLDAQRAIKEGLELAYALR